MGRSGPNHGSSSARCSSSVRARADAMPGVVASRSQHGLRLAVHLVGRGRDADGGAVGQRLRTSGRPAGPRPAQAPGRRPRERPSPPRSAWSARPWGPTGGTTRSRVRRQRHARVRASVTGRPRQAGSAGCGCAARGPATCAFACADQVQIMGGDQDRLAHPVQLHQQRQQPQRHLPVDIAGRLVGEDHVRGR